jgi:hypothetical protein
VIDHEQRGVHLDIPDRRDVAAKAATKGWDPALAGRS